jgi:uncharacterized protein involved in tellurium resistance
MAHEHIEHGASPQGPVTELSDRASWDLLQRATFGHLGVSLDGRPGIFPVDFRVDGETIVFRTAIGTKLAELVANPHVAFEVDDRTELGTGRQAADLLIFPDWIPVEVYVYVRIVASEIRGRVFAPRARLGLV